MDSQAFFVERDDHIATLWLDRPEARYAMGAAFFSDLPLLIDELDQDQGVRVIILAAKGPHFSVGLDLKDMGSLLAGDRSDSTKDKPKASKASEGLRTRATVLRMQRAISAVARCEKPVIAAIHGACIGGGVDLISACDIRLASLDAIFSVRETKMAIVADLGSLQRLPKIIGAGHLAELVYSGCDIDAKKAFQIGLVNSVFDDPEKLIVGAHKLGQEIASNSPLAVQGSKAVLFAGEHMSTEQALEYVAAWNAGMLQSYDLTEAVMAFLEKRPPKFTGN